MDVFACFLSVDKTNCILYIIVVTGPHYANLGSSNCLDAYQKSRDITMLLNVSLAIVCNCSLEHNGICMSLRKCT